MIGGFAGDQRFFMGWAQVWRTLMRDDALRQQIMTDSHSPGGYRVNGVLRNIPESTPSTSSRATRCTSLPSSA